MLCFIITILLMNFKLSIKLGLYDDFMLTNRGVPKTSPKDGSKNM